MDFRCGSDRLERLLPLRVNLPFSLTGRPAVDVLGTDAARSDIHRTLPALDAARNLIERQTAGPVHAIAGTDLNNGDGEQGWRFARIRWRSALPMLQFLTIPFRTGRFRRLTTSIRVLDSAIDLASEQ